MARITVFIERKHASGFRLGDTVRTPECRVSEVEEAPFLTALQSQHIDPVEPEPRRLRLIKDLFVISHNNCAALSVVGHGDRSRVYLVRDSLLDSLLQSHLIESLFCFAERPVHPLAYLSRKIYFGIEPPVME